MENRREKLIRTVVSVSFLLMIAINVLGEALPLGGRTTGEVSDRYANLFTPAGYTFAIWGVIYLLTGVYTLYQLGLFRGRNETVNDERLRLVAALFCVSSLANAAWIVFWHYEMIPWSMVMMAVILAALMRTMVFLRGQKLTSREKFLVRLPFSVYFGWITVAAIANATVLLVDLGWNRWGFSESFWTAAMLIAGALIGAAWIHRSKDMAYGLVLLWAYSGIMVKHFSSFEGRHPGVIVTAAVCVASIIAVLTRAVLRGNRKPKAA